MDEKQKPARGPTLNTAGKVTAEMGKIYRLAKLNKITPEQYKVWNDGLAKMRGGMPDHEVMREIEALRAVAARASSTVVPFKRSAS